MTDIRIRAFIVKIVVYAPPSPVSVYVHEARVRHHNWLSNVDAVQEFETSIFFCNNFLVYSFWYLFFLTLHLKVFEWMCSAVVWLCFAWNSFCVSVFSRSCLCLYYIFPGCPGGQKRKQQRLRFFTRRSTKERCSTTPHVGPLVPDRAATVGAALMMPLLGRLTVAYEQNGMVWSPVPDIFWRFSSSWVMLTFCLNYTPTALHPGVALTCWQR